MSRWAKIGSNFNFFSNHHEHIVRLRGTLAENGVAELSASNSITAEASDATCQ